eukprot:3520352-Alexandrium_andersonii.AAC.1
MQYKTSATGRSARPKALIARTGFRTTAHCSANTGENSGLCSRQSQTCGATDSHAVNAGP